MTERAAFGLELRQARERRGLTLEQVSDQTKVSVAHFAGLERGDLSRWPPGIFGRAFVRNYAIAVGLDPDDIVVQFGRVFMDPVGDAHQTPSPEPALRNETPVLRLVLDDAPPNPSGRRLETALRRVLSGLIDVSLALVPATCVGLVAGWGWFWIAAASVGLAGHLGTASVMGTTPGSWLLARRRRVPRTGSADTSVRRRLDTEVPISARRHVSRQMNTRPASHAHRVRH